MADDINKKITIDVEVNTNGQQEINQYKAAFDSLRNSINGLSNPLSGLSNTIASLDKDVSKLNESITKLNVQNQGLAGSGDKVRASVNELAGTIDSFGKIVNLVKGGVTSFEAALTGGLSLLAAFGPEIVDWISSLIKGKEAVDKAKLSVDTLNGALESSDYSNAIKQMNELKINVGLAKKGLLDKKEVLQQYNESLGKTMGRAADLNKVENNIVKNGATYIKMTLLKASAQLALQDAAKKAYEAEQDRLKSDDDTLSFMDKAWIYIKEGAAGAAGMGNAVAQAQVDMVVKATQKRKEAIDDANKQKDALLSIAAKFQIEAAAIAKNAGFDLFSGHTMDSGKANNNDSLAEALSQTEKIRKDSLTRQLQDTYEAYGSETLAENGHYNDELNKLKGFLKNKQLTKKQFDEVSGQLDSEHKANLAAIMNKYNEQDKERTVQAQNDLVELQIKAMQAGSEKQIAELKQQQVEKNQQFDKLDADSLDRIAKLNAEINAAKHEDKNADTTGLQRRLDTEYGLMKINCQKKELLAQQTADAIKKTNDEDNQNALIKKDQKAVDSADGPEARLTAEKQLITDKYSFEIEQAQGSSKKIAEIAAQRDKEIKDLTDKAAKEKSEKDKKTAQELKDFEVQEAKKVSEAAFTIISNSIKQASESKIAGLEKDKTAELSSTALTSAQKLAIEQKYKKQEAQVKVKAFKEEQEASIAQAVINGALAITKGTSQSGILAALYVPTIIAETAVQVAKIAAQKPPAYAQGGLHYSSDGRGGLLSGYSKTDNTNAYLRSGEGVVVSEAMQVPWARNLVSAINVGFGGRDFSITSPGRGYAVGGIFTDGGDANRYYNQPVHDQKNLANSIAYQMINNFPPVYVDVKDINNQQNILAQTINRVNL